jgi:hypothetical protein
LLCLNTLRRYKQLKARSLTLSQITATFVPFGLLLAAALLAAEATLDLPQYRMIYSIWVSLVLAIPALCLFILPGASQTRSNFWALLWTFAYCAYLVHFYYAVFLHYHGSFSEMISHQGLKIAGPNLLVTAWWGFDVVLAWTIDSSRSWVRVERTLAHFLVSAIFFVSSVLIFKGFVNLLGYTMTAAIAICIAIRIFQRRTTSSATSQTTAAA